LGRFINRVGLRYGNLEVVSLVSRSSKLLGTKTMWSCICDCGDISTYSSSNLVTGNSTKCLNCRIANQITHDNAGRGRESGTYRSHQHMLQRCCNEENDNYHHYGGRGIKVCDEWSGESGFVNFLRDMGNRPSNTSLDRVDVNGDYTPENCRWVSNSMQSYNRRKKEDNGVYFRKDTNKWSAYINKDRKRYNLGCFDNKEDALNKRKQYDDIYSTLGEKHD